MEEIRKKGMRKKLSDKNKRKYDFAGWVTKNDIRCSDGRTIKKDAFKHNDQQKVPLVWNHGHDEVSNTLGHSYLTYEELLKFSMGTSHTCLYLLVVSSRQQTT